jgi:hypothetical protein
MAFTRFHDDPARIKKQLEESSFAGRYQLDVPGPGTNMPFFEDPQIRLQGWGANMRQGTVNLESDLRGLTRPLNRDLTDANDYTKHQAFASRLSFPVQSAFIDETRASHPAWMYRDLEQSRWEAPLLNPQNRIEPEFYTNVQTRILEKDQFVPSVPVVNGIETEYYLTGATVCAGGAKTCTLGTLYENRIR